MFKVGDKVKVDFSKRLPMSWWDDLDENKVYTIMAAYPDTDDYYIDDEFEYVFSADWLIAAPQFKLGDLVIGNEKNTYSITNRKNVSKVVGYSGNNLSVYPVDKNVIHPACVVQADVFGLYLPKKQNQVEVKDLVWEGKTERVKFIINDRTTVCILSDGTKGIAKCDPNDEFVKDYGQILAYQRARYNQLFGKVKQADKGIKVGDTVKYASASSIAGRVAGVVKEFITKGDIPAVRYIGGGWDFLDCVEKA